MTIWVKEARLVFIGKAGFLIKSVYINYNT